MPVNQEHVHLVWPLWSDLRVIPTHGEFHSLVRPYGDFCTFLLGGLKSCMLVASIAINACRLPLALRVYSLVRPLMTTTVIVLSVEDKLPILEQPIPAMPVPPVGLRYIDNLKRLGHAMTQNLAVSLILISLRKEYDRFVQNYNMYSMGKTVTELHAMLKLHEQTLPQKDVAPALHAIRAGRVQKNQKKKPHKDAKGNQGKGKAMMGYAPVAAPPFAPKPKNPPTPKMDNPAKDAICHQCGEVGHWRRICPIYLAELMKKKKLSQGASTSGCGTHICITTQGLKGSRKLKLGALSMYVGDGHRATVEAIGEFHLCLPSGLVLILHNCHYAPSITRGTISVSRLYKDGFVNRFENGNSISVSKNNLIYFNAIPQDDIYEIVLSSVRISFHHQNTKIRKKRF
ncbi:zinc finger, CCHC-type containing protein [Tanacetum coccineum]